MKLQGNLSSSKVEQHYATKSRYSYLVEEDSDSDDFESGSVPSHNQSTKTQGQIQPNLKFDMNTHFDNDSCGRHPGNNNVVNFEKYRMENSKLFHYYPQLLFGGGKHSKNHDQQLMGSQIEHFDNMNEKTPLKNEKLYRNGSSNSTITSFAEGGQLSKPKTQSSIESEASSDTSPRTKEGGQAIYISTPKKSTSSPTIDSSFMKEISREPLVPYKAHRKKSSFSLKGLFRSPKSSKSKSFSQSRDSIEDNSHAYRQNQSSLESSPRKATQQLRKFIFPANPSFHVKPGTSQQEMQAKNQHFRSLSDFHKVSSAQHEEQAAINSHHQGKTMHSYNNTRKLSLDSTRPALPVSSFVTPPHSRQRSDNCLQLNAVKNEEENFAAGSANKSSPTASNQIEMAIHMRNKGRPEESAKRLQKACLTQNKTAYLLYGLALRNGCGVAKDYKESFRYISDAAGIHSEDEEIFNFNVNPFQLEKDNVLEIVPEPLAPALYECGIAYLKGYGFDREDEIKGLKYLEKAASYGHIDSICLSGTICSKKSSVRKRDISRAASWFRLAEKRGANLIGSEWIHKDKYLKAST